ncbi:MAG: lipopolysaccharide heptosyltransferase II [Thermodesulfobacteriota bacterium]
MNLLGRKVDHILVRATNWVGDALMTTPALAALKDNFPEARLTVLAKEWVAPIYAGHPAVEAVMVLDRRGRHQGLTGLVRLAGEVRRRGFDLAVLFQNAFEAALIAWLARVPLRLGYGTDGRGWLLNPAVRLGPEDRLVHQTEYYLRLLSRAGLAARPSRPVFHLSVEARRQARKRLEELNLTGSFLLGIAPGAAYGPAKQWPASKFASTAGMILDQTGGAALVFGSRGDVEAAGLVLNLLPGRSFNLAGRTGLAEAAALIQCCGLFLSNDSGLMHVAAAVGSPLLAVFGSTDPTATGPLGDLVRVIRHPVDCSPCFRPVCPRDGHPCLDLVTAEEVAGAGLKLIERRR